MFKQRLEQTQQQKLSYHQIILMKMLLDSKVEFEDRLKQELEENPALETAAEEEENKNEAETDLAAPEEPENIKEDFDLEDYYDLEETSYNYKTYSNNTNPDEESYERQIASGNTFQEQLKEQISLQEGDKTTRTIANYLVDCLDENGFLRISFSELCDDLAFREGFIAEEELLEKSLSIIQQCDPPGIGARDIKECLLLQLKRKKNHHIEIDIAEKIVRENFDDLALRNYRKIMLKNDLSREILEDALSVITHLSPYPVFTGSSAVESSGEYIIPDFILSNDDDCISVSLNNRNEPELRINKKYLEQLENFRVEKKKKLPDQHKEGVKFIRTKIESARAFIDAVKLRQKTILKVVNAIIKKQPEFFKEGDIKKLRPMVLKDIAEMTGMEISTISRITSSKYIQTPYGIFLLKHFFSEGLMKDDGEEASSKEIKEIISEVISAEDKNHPLTDIDLSKLLKEKGYNVARRTITKYRKFLKIMSSKMRKDWK